jgi:hypothetical protein
VRTTEELLEGKVAASVWKTKINDRENPLRWPHDTLYPQKQALTSPTSGDRSVGIVRSRTKATEFSLVFRWLAFRSRVRGSYTLDFILYSREQRTFLAKAVIKSSVFWDITPCTPLKVSRRFGGKYRLHLQDWRISHHEADSKFSSFAYSSILKMEATGSSEMSCFMLVFCLACSSTLKLETCSSKTSLDFQRTTQRCTPEHRTLHNYRCENLKSYKAGLRLILALFLTFFTATFL